MSNVQVQLRDILNQHTALEKGLYRGIDCFYENFVFSSLGFHSLLMLISQGTSETTKDDIIKALQIADAKKTLEVYRNLISSLNSFRNVDLRIENKIFLNENYGLRETYKSDVEKGFLSQVEALDFTDYEAAVKPIESWLSEKTNKKITELFSNSSFNNVVYFKSKWAEAFDAKNTVDGEFFSVKEDTEDIVDVQMMNAQQHLNYKNDQSLGAKVLELPYSNTDLSLIIILPNDKFKMDKLQKKIAKTDLLKLTEDMTKTLVDVSLPKFKFEDNMYLPHALELAQLSFVTSNTTNLHGICTCPAPFCINEASAKTFIEVNEEGTEATEVVGYPTILKHPFVYEMDMKVNISNHFATTLIVSKMKNTEGTAMMASFTTVLPENAFISEFMIEIDGESYKSYVAKREEAQQIFGEARAASQRGGYMAFVDKNNQISVEVNVEPRSLATFLLTYEELLQRNDKYELVLNIHPGQVVPNLNVEVHINETRPLKYVKTPALRTGNGINENEENLDPASNIQIVNATTAVVKFNPDLEKQKLFARALHKSEVEGLSGQFIVQYDVERDPKGGEILLQDGYFIHFFSPSDLESLSKHVVFVLDTSCSMEGSKLKQVQDAVVNILSNIRENDVVNIIEFNKNVIVWDINSESPCIVTYDEVVNYKEPFNKLRQINLPSPTLANDEFISKAKSVVQKIKADGWTHLIGGLEVALHLINQGQEKLARQNGKYQPIIVLLTDGDANDGIDSTTEIINIVTRLNHANNKVPIFSFSFGEEVDKVFLKQLSIKNMGFSKHIYEGTDVSLQLQQFYKQISSPLLSDVEFNYDTDIDEVTRLHFPTYFEGSELVVTGRCRGECLPSSTIKCCGRSGQLTLKPVIERPITSLERVWAYLTVKQLLEERDLVDEKKELTKKALDVALKYSFVTDVSFVKPDQSDDILYVEELPEKINTKYWEFEMCDCNPNRPVRKSLFKVRKSRITEDEDEEKVEDKDEEEVEDEDEEEVEDEDSLDDESWTTEGESISDPPDKPVIAEDESLSDPAETFLANHPFIIIVQFKIGNERGVLFNGLVRKPVY